MALGAGFGVEVIALSSGLRWVKFVGGPLDGQKRALAKSMKKFSPYGPEKGTYWPTKPDSGEWKWKEGE